jgi:uncharacterized protein YdiU (UPF0061 family)
MTTTMTLPFDNSYARQLDGFYARCQPEGCSDPELLYLNQPLAGALGLNLERYSTGTLAQLFSGNLLPEEADPIAQVYAGHQFGAFNPQLGDGRALIIGEVVNERGERSDISFKGSGRTPFARGGDGKAAVGPMLREVLIGEALHALGVPGTRALAVTATGEDVHRETVLPGSVLTRVAASHIRIGTFQYFGARGQIAQVRRLADYAIARHYPALVNAPDRYLALLRHVLQGTAALVAQWMGVGFIHGVMNTDNMSIAAETIDYGPCAFMERYDPRTVFSSIDHQGRYAYGNQPVIAHWNLARLAESLLPLFADDAERATDLATEVIESFPGIYQDAFDTTMWAKLGIRSQAAQERCTETSLLTLWLHLLQTQRVDFTLAWRSLADAAHGELTRVRSLFTDQAPLNAWLKKWQDCCALDDREGGSPESSPDRAEAMRAVNPFIIARNHQVEHALKAASDEGNLEPFTDLLAALQRPYDEHPELAGYGEPAPESFTASYRTFCGT